MISNGGRSPRRHTLTRYLGIGATAITAAAVALAGGMPVLAAAVTAPAAASGGWSGPRELQGPRGIIETGSFTALSCTSRSDCTAVGSFLGRSGPERDFAVTERRGIWGRAVVITAPTAIRFVSFGAAPVLSCASAGNCAAGDSYFASGQQGAFVISETNGTWGRARKVRGTPSAISCPAPGDCTAAVGGGLISEVHGTWGRAFPVPSAGVGVISCPSLGNCAAAGDGPSGGQVMVVTQRHGTWGKPQPVRGLAGAQLDITALSCLSAGNCVAAGDAYRLADRRWGSFAVTEAHGRWGPARFLPGTFKLRDLIDQLACPAAGACSATGEGPPLQGSPTFVSTEKNGTWRSAQIITGPGLSPAGLGGSLSCHLAGSCVLAGIISVGSGAQSASAVRVNGRWGPARILRGVRAVARGRNSAIEVVSCPARSRCTAVGSFSSRLSGQLFAVVQR